MSKTEFMDVISIIRGAYARSDMLKDINEVNVWFESLCDLESKWVKNAVSHWVKDSKFPPAISEIRDLAKKIAQQEYKAGNAKRWQ